MPELKRTIRETLIHSADEMKRAVHGTRQPGPINQIGEAVSAAQRSDLLVQSIHQRFLSHHRAIS